MLYCCLRAYAYSHVSPLFADISRAALLAALPL